jgi:hypothetical protein
LGCGKTLEPPEFRASREPGSRGAKLRYNPYELPEPVMRLTPTLLTLAALAALASNAHAATYWLGGGGPRAWWFVDSDTIERDRDHPRGWILNVYRGKGPAILGKQAVGARSHVEADCPGKRIRYIVNQPLDAKAAPIVDTKGGEAWLGVEPRTPGEAQLNYLCGIGPLLGAAPLQLSSAGEILAAWGVGKPRAETLANIGR